MRAEHRRTWILSSIGVVAAALATAWVASSGDASAPAAPDFYHDSVANQAAATMGERLLNDLDTVPTFGGAQIVRSGVEVETVGPPAPAILAAVARNAASFAGAPIPVSYRQVARSQKELRALTDKLSADQEYWKGRDINLTSWGPDVDSNTVLVRLQNYSPAAAAAIVAHYGNAVSVYPHNVAAAGS